MHDAFTISDQIQDEGAMSAQKNLQQEPISYLY